MFARSWQTNISKRIVETLDKIFSWPGHRSLSEKFPLI